MEALLASRWTSGRCVVSSYFELARARQLCEMAHCMESAAGAMGVSTVSTIQTSKRRELKIELEAIQADLEHRQAYAELKALTGER